MKQGRLVFITINEEQSKSLGGIDTAIPLPIELGPDETELNRRELTTEMFLSGMLRCLSLDSEGEHSEYYRAIINAVKPAILHELNAAAILKSRNGDNKSALEIFLLLEGLVPDHPLVLLNKALVVQAIFSESDGDTGPFDAWEKALAVTEDCRGSVEQDILFYAGLFFNRSGNYRRAVYCLESFLDAAGMPEDDNDEETNKKKAAAALLQEIKNNNLEDDDFRDARDLLMKKDSGREEEALPKIRNFLARYPQSGKGWFLLGWGLRRLGRWEDGASCFEKAVEHGCDNSDARNELAICRMELGDYDEAERSLKKAFLSDPDNPKIICNLGVLALKKGNKEEAEGFFRTALELNPEVTDHENKS
ncbi:MAG: tetratricopeptide repeat protein [Treponema sp.]|jgi:tetratricopeptide (TPR) repeat protein|nr:tetratricopeptide repeat protein [Treponema sp.]